MQHLSAPRTQYSHAECIIHKIRDYFRPRSHPKLRGQLHHFRLLSFPMIKSSMRDLVEHMYETGSREETMAWSSRQWKTLQIRRMAQLMTHTVDFRPFVTSPAFSRMIETFQTQDAYGAAVHMDHVYFHVFLIGTTKKLEYLRFPSCDLNGVHVRDLVKHITTARGHLKDTPSGDASRKIHISALHSQTEDNIKDVSQVLCVLWEVLVKPIVRALQLKVSHIGDINNSWP